MFRRFYLLFVLTLCVTTLCGAAPAKVGKTEVHPAFWWAGMKNTTLQVLIYSDLVKDCEAVLSGAEGVVIDHAVRLKNQNYLILYLNTNGAQPQKFSIKLYNGKKLYKEIPYELKQRSSRPVNSFDAGDVVYLLMPDRFATGTTDEQKKQMYKGMKQDTWSSADMARHGGDLAGMTKHLDYLQDLGVTAVWHTPTLENDMPEQSYHGYAITNYYRTDPRIGSNEDYRNWVDECHKRGIKVIKDIVFNHCGSENFLFRDRPADDWFTYNSVYTPTTYKTGMPGDPNTSKLDFDLTVDGWFTMAMPDFNGRNPLVADYLIQTSIWWIEYAGIDGIRQDTYPYNDFDFMRRWCMDVEREYPGFNIVGETWINNPVAVSYWQKDSPLAAPKNSELKTVMDFPMMYMLNSCVDEETDTWDHGFARLCDLLGQDRVYANPNSVFTFLANHDTNRFQPTEEKAKDITRYKQALALLLTLRGIPQLYYGDEIGMFANKSVNDGALRQNFPGGWPGDKNNAFTAEGRTELQAQYHDYTRRLLNWRKGNETVCYGSLVQFTVRDGVYVYARVKDGKTVAIVANGTSKPAKAKSYMYKEVLPAGQAYDVISGNTVTFGEEIELAPKQIMILDFTK